jgi:hypothetical protein
VAINRFQSCAHDVVIILAPGIAADPAESIVIDLAGIRRRGVVKLADDENTARRLEEKTGVSALAGAMVRQIAHPAGEAASGPTEVVIGLKQGRGRGDAGQVESMV